MDKSKSSALQQEALQRLKHIIAEIPFNKVLGLQLDKVETDEILLSFPAKPELIGNFVFHILHGGAIATALDMAGGVAAMLALILQNESDNLEDLQQALSKVRTITLATSFIKPAKGERFFAGGKIIYAGHKICHTFAEVKNELGILIASANGTYLLK